MKTAFLFLFASASIFMPSISRAQESSVLNLSGNLEREGRLVPGQPPVWKYYAGDHPDGAAWELDDQNWESIIDHSFDANYVPVSGWPGIGWFRLHFKIDSTLVNVPLALFFELYGAAEIYLNGRLIDSYGQVGLSAEEERSIRTSFRSPRYTPLQLADSSEPYVLAIRNSNFVAASFYLIGNLKGGFGIVVSYPERALHTVGTSIRKETAIQIAFTSFPAAFALIFAILYAFYPRDRQYLYFALLALGVAAMTFVDLELEFLTENLNYWSLRRVLMACNVFTIFMLMHMVHDLFYEAMPKHYYLFLGVSTILGILSVIFPFSMFRTVVVLGLIVMAEIVRVVVRAIRRRRAGAWILGVGILFFIAGISYDLLLDLGILSALGGITNGYHLGFIGMLVAMAIYLGQRLARTNKDLSDQIVQVQHLSEQTLRQERRAREQEMETLRLEAENERKQLELEKAKELAASYEALEKAHQHLKTTQTQLIHAEKMASLGQLTAGIAHEIKNPLNFVDNFAQLNTELTDELLEASRSGVDVALLLEDLKANASRIVEHSRRANDIVGSMMRHASGAKVNRRPAELNRLVEEYVNLAYHSMRARMSDFDATIEVDCDKRIGEIEMAPQEIGQVLINLINNAFDALREKAKRQIEGYVPRLGVETRGDGNSVEIRVSDNGTGMPDQVRNRVFEPFFTTKPPGAGTGLGLSLSYDIVVHGHGGTLSVESEPDTGTTFIVRLPR